MTENDLAVARDIGSLQADVRTIKHDIANVGGKIDALGNMIGKLNTQQAKGVGFWAGALFIVTTGMSVAGAIFALIRTALGGHG